MEGNEARRVLGFAPNSRPTPSEVKAAYKKKIWESHPDLFPAPEKPQAESRFKLLASSWCNRVLVELKALLSEDFYTIFHSISQAYACLLSGGRGDALNSAEYSRVVRTGVPRASGGRKNHPLIKVPFILIILGTAALGGVNAARAYKKQKEDYPSHNPFLP